MPQSPDDEITVTMTRRQALGLEKLGDLGVRASEAFGLVPNTSSGEQGLNAVRRALAETRK